MNAFTPGRLANAGLALAEMQCGRTRVRSRPVVLRVEPTNVCNLHCPRCSCGINTDPRPKGMMAPEDFRLLLEENAGSATLLRLDGNGEPTLHPRIFEMIALAKSFGYAVSMSTNMNTRQSFDAAAHVESGLDRLVIALDGTTQETHQQYRVGGSLAQAEEGLQALLTERRRRGLRRPLVEVQFLDWGYNHREIPLMQQKVRQWGADKLQVISPDWAVMNARADSRKPRRCFWLWFVLTVDWAMNYRSCTNAWTFPWPRLNLKEVSTRQFWNHEKMVAARQYNIDKSAAVIGLDAGCNCNNCCDMLVVNRPPAYICQ
jgi:hypothetical protein